MLAPIVWINSSYSTYNICCLLDNEGFTKYGEFCNEVSPKRDQDLEQIKNDTTASFIDFAKRNGMNRVIFHFTGTFLPSAFVDYGMLQENDIQIFYVKDVTDEENLKISKLNRTK